MACGRSLRSRRVLRLLVACGAVADLPDLLVDCQRVRISYNYCIIVIIHLHAILIFCVLSVFCVLACISAFMPLKWILAHSSAVLARFTALHALGFPRIVSRCRRAMLCNRFTGYYFAILGNYGTLGYTSTMMHLKLILGAFI